MVCPFVVESIFKNKAMAKDKDYTSQYIKDRIVDEMIKELMPPKYDLDPYSLDSAPFYENDIFKPIREPVPTTRLKPASHKSKPAYKKSKGPKELKSASKSMLRESADRKAKMIGEKYAAGILEKYGCQTAIMQKGFGYDLLVLSANREDIARFNVITDRNSGSKFVEIETFWIRNNEVITDITNGLPDCYLFVFCGTPGFYHIATDKLRDLIAENCQESISSDLSDNRRYCEIDRDLLINNSRYLVYPCHL